MLKATASKPVESIAKSLHQFAVSPGDIDPEVRQEAIRTAVENAKLRRGMASARCGD